MRVVVVAGAFLLVLALAQGRRKDKGTKATMPRPAKNNACEVGQDCPDETYCCDHIRSKCYKVVKKPPKGNCRFTNDCPRGYDCKKKKCMRKDIVDRWC